MGITVAIVGRPNTGKSTLFNRLVGKRLAIVDDAAGVTRDRREGDGSLGDLHFRVVDTAGFDGIESNNLAGRMQQQTKQAVSECDVVLMLIDARAGINPLDRFFANWLRGQSAFTILIANKCEGGGGVSGRLEAFELGLGDPLAISAEHGEGLADLYTALQPIFDHAGNSNKLATPPELQLAIVGRPNTGKSTLVNQLLKNDRMLTGPEAGITRDSIGIELHYQGHSLKLIDTAGLRRKARVDDKLEKLSALDTLRAIRYAQVAVVLLDGQQPVERQDITIARQVADEGRALIIAVNKCDLLVSRKNTKQMLEQRLESSLAQVRGVPIITLSALTGRGIKELMEAVFSIYQTWNRRVTTAQLNRWLADMVEIHPPPLASSGRRIKLRYITQIKSRPPTFAIWVSRPKNIAESYKRYLIGGLRESFGLCGVPIRMEFRQGKNPYSTDK
ncbi:MAG: ribosome biogenesis GTPase Der [Pseudomonadota bacterium]|nr:ribosome biogenesis GTPase Der [Pseudomonadota bacterium]